jgi:hypothetical protein
MEGHIMKTKNTLLAITVITSILLITLCGCSSSTNEINPAQSADNYGEALDSYAPLQINVNAESSFKDELIRLIGISKKYDEKHGDINVINDDYYDDINAVNDGDYAILEINEIILPTIDIDGYVPYGFSISRQRISYFYVSADVQKKENENKFNYNTGIQIMVTRPGWVRDESVNQFEFLKEHSTRYVLTKDNMLYEEYNEGTKGGLVYAPMGENSCLMVLVPQKLNTYEYLRDLAFEVIETAELVNVEKLIAEKPDSFFVTDVPVTEKYVPALDTGSGTGIAIEKTVPAPMTTSIYGGTEYTVPPVN